MGLGTVQHGVQLMNRATTYRRLNKLADHLETVPEKLFDMENWAVKTSCGTRACIAGHACAVVPRQMRMSVEDGVPRIQRRVGGRWAWDSWPTGLFAETFGVTDEEAEALCAPYGSGYRKKDVPKTPKQAARAVRKLAKKYAPEAK